MPTPTSGQTAPLSYLLGDQRLAQIFAQTTAAHRLVEQDFRRRLTQVSPSLELSFPNADLPDAEYLPKNLFSIFLLSILGSLGIAPARLHSYGLITHAIRGVVTATDNILDRESKGVVLLRMGSAMVAPNMMLALLQDGLIHQAVAELSPDPALRRESWHALMRAVFAILREESGEEGTVEAALPPDGLLEMVHSFRGGRLFQLAFVVPEVQEPQLAQELARATAGVYAFGLAIQLLDDVADLAEDIARRNHNMLRSWIVHRAPDGPLAESELLAMRAEDLRAPEQRFPEATRAVVRYAASTALGGFNLLEQAGYPLSQQSALGLLAMLFQIRGVQRLWDMATAP